ncbi:sensor histidine kinase [Mucilaginibacter boryungensis]|uniref:Sensor histidine kinase n=1 Tax=Mucilaginibacter boryungensis TaxID=768480 RepID=A0ABR9XMU2_9SPHI|nr:ATP-binding protein [Mucilaginibacter boryungensis]MBE9668570.1 sensor histidine kinase [Mucilaginibacter boryungensis]
MLQADQDYILIIVAGTIMLLLLGIFIISFLFFYQKKRTIHITEQEQLKSAFSQEILTTQIEVQEQTLNYISQELHDNIGQVLSFVKLNLGTTTMLTEEKKQRKIDESRDLLAQAISDLRDLSKSLSFQQIKQFGLVRAMLIEIERVNKSGLIKITMEVTGDAFSLGEQRELVLFRIFQEALNNALKYSHAINLVIQLNFSAHLFALRIADDGIGFSPDMSGDKNGSGLKNMESRAALIGARATLESSPGQGCIINITLDPFKQLNIDGTHSNSTV